MARRRNLRLPSSSDEDDDPRPPSSNSNFPSSPPPSPPLEISSDADDVFLDVPDDFSPPNPNPNPNPNVDQVDAFLRRSGLGLRREWLEGCVGEIERSGGLGFGNSGVEEKARVCFERFLVADMNVCGGGVLPAGVGGMHLVELEGPFVLQVDEVINICSSIRERFHDSPAGLKRCLKLSLTDGIQRVFGMEYRPISDLHIFPAGLKVIIRNVHIRRGLLMLVPEVLEVLGGLFEDLEAARQRLLYELDKPPRSKRKQGALPLSKRACLAAWASSTADHDAVEPNMSMPHTSNNSRAAEPNMSVPHSANNYRPTVQAANIASSENAGDASAIQEFDDPEIGENTASELTVQGIEERAAEEFIAPHSMEYVIEPPPSNRPQVEELEVFIAPHDLGSNTNTELTASDFERSIVNEFVAPHVMESVKEEPTSSSRQEIDPNTIMSSSPQVDDPLPLDMEVEDGEMEHPLILSGDREMPFTYLASLLAKWATQKDHAPYIQGKIKCTLTGVKGFQFKHRSTYELHVYVDDGSLISEILIDHHVVEKGIGHSPEEVTAALTSSDKKTVTDMKEKMKKFQLFLANFEGTMLMGINNNSAFPVALEMNQGCSTSDGWMLLRRLKIFIAPQKLPESGLKTIVLSP